MRLQEWLVIKGFSEINFKNTKNYIVVVLLHIKLFLNL
jgi:hypothetical protein